MAENFTAKAHHTIEHCNLFRDVEISMFDKRKQISGSDEIVQINQSLFLILWQTQQRTII